MIWAFYALLYSLFRALFVEAGRIFKGDPWVRTFWQAVFGFLLLLPFLPAMAWPLDDGRFYFAAAMVGMIVTVGCAMQLTLSERQSGRITGISMPVETAMAFLIWLAITPSSLHDVYSDALRIAAVLLAFAVAGIALLIVRPNDITLGNVALVAPVGISFAIAGVVTKLALPAGFPLSVALTYALINFGVMIIVMGVALLLKRKMARAAFTVEAIRGGVTTGLFSAASYTTFVMAVALAPNPGYASFMAMLLPVWMIGLHKLTGAEEKASPVAAFLLTISAVMLIVAVV